MNELMERFENFYNENCDNFETEEELVRAFCNDNCEDLWSWQALYEELMECFADDGDYDEPEDLECGYDPYMGCYTDDV